MSADQLPDTSAQSNRKESWSIGAICGILTLVISLVGVWAKWQDVDDKLAALNVKVDAILARPAPPIQQQQAIHNHAAKDIRDAREEFIAIQADLIRQKDDLHANREPLRSSE